MVLQQVLPTHGTIRKVHNKQHRDGAGGGLEEGHVEGDEGGVLPQPAGEDRPTGRGWWR